MGSAGKSHKPGTKFGIGERAALFTFEDAISVPGDEPVDPIAEETRKESGQFSEGTVAVSQLENMKNRF